MIDTNKNDIERICIIIDNISDTIKYTYDNKKNIILLKNQILTYFEPFANDVSLKIITSSKINNIKITVDKIYMTKKYKLDSVVEFTKKKTKIDDFLWGVYGRLRGA